MTMRVFIATTVAATIVSIPAFADVSTLTVEQRAQYDAKLTQCVSERTKSSSRTSISSIEQNVIRRACEETALAAVTAGPAVAQGGVPIGGGLPASTGPFVGPSEMAAEELNDILSRQDQLAPLTRSVNPQVPPTLSVSAQSARTASSWEQSCLGNEIGRDRAAYCAAYGAFMTSMTPMQRSDYDHAFATCSDKARNGDKKWSCEKAAYEAARVAPGSGPGVNLPSSQSILTVPKDFSTTPLPNLEIDDAFKSERDADNAALMTIRVPIEYSGLPSLSVLRKHFGLDPLAAGGEPYLVAHCKISKRSPVSSVEAAAGIPWVENGAERTDTLSVRFFDRFSDGTLPATGEEFQCAPWFATYDQASGAISVFKGGAGDGMHSGNLCLDTPGYEVGQDDYCASISGELERGKIVKVGRYWNRFLPDGTSSEDFSQSK
ncbi:hypothetical protein K1X12_14615 [Hyphomonas sp. WL0036]|uniref:hypothetical protein n=1 Tax=Hyphomonas sediminis TaxID=2866160 RepID=UPI001C80B3BD|nr:hypothetical protein [Hyphomonas sediminis]MBY9068141.1 hypothetical protein [Hyphomonas sediminis]